MGGTPWSNIPCKSRSIVYIDNHLAIFYEYPLILLYPLMLTEIYILKNYKTHVNIK